MNPLLEGLYFEWLYEQVADLRATNENERFTRLLKLLHEKEFVWIVPNDDNRLEDGRDLRHEFIGKARIKLVESEWDSEWLHIGCSMLELLVGLSRRLAFEAEGSVHNWFWELMGNVDLIRYSDRYEFHPKVVNEVLDRIIWRNYGRDGEGGLFPLKSSRVDQRKVELWYQLSAYLAERE